MDKRPLEEIKEEEIITRVLEGDVDAFSHLIQKYQRRVYALGMRFFHNQADADDFVQEVFIKVFKNLSGYRGEARFYSWLMRIAYNLGIDTIRTYSAYAQMPEIDFEDSSLGPEDSAILRESSATIKQAIESLPKKYAICLDLYFSFGLKYREISSITGIPVNTIKSHVFRAKEALRETLRDFAEEVYHGM